MACIVFGIKLKVDSDYFKTKLESSLCEKDKRKSKRDEEFWDDISVPLTLKNGYKLWQPNNETNSFAYLALDMVLLSNEDEESCIFTLPIKENVDTFKNWLAENHIKEKYAKYLIVKY